VGDLEDTHCPACGETVISRLGYHVQRYTLTPDGTCPACRATVPGRWDARFGGQITDRPFLPGGRLRVV
jgi:hypothetical protein